VIRGKAVAVAGVRVVAEVAVVVRVVLAADRMEMVVVDKAGVEVAEVVRVVLAAAVDHKDVLVSGTSAVRGSQVKMAGLPKLTRHRGPFPNQMLLPAS
jgi:hypothetical protein